MCNRNVYGRETRGVVMVMVYMADAGTPINMTPGGVRRDAHDLAHTARTSLCGEPSATSIYNGICNGYVIRLL